MEFSKYNYLFNSSKHGFLLYNGETNSFAKLDKELFNLLLTIENDSKNIEKLDEDIKNQLINCRVLVKDRTHLFNKKRLDYYKKTFDKTNLGLVIAPTTHCNFNCPYCYEENKLPIFMNEDTEFQLIDFIQKHESVEILNITWYGGEPLLKFDTIKRILVGIKKNVKKTIGLHSMTTNGYLLDEEKSMFFKDYPLTSIQITIDGAKENHDKRRTLIPNIPTFDKIIENIDRFSYLNPDTYVCIRTNLDNSNIDTFPAILKDFNSMWWDKGRKVVVYPAFVRDYTESCKNNCLLVNRVQKMDFFIDLYKNHDINVGFFPEYCTGGCGATVLNYYVVGPTGELYKCWNDLGVAEAIVGHINKDEITNSELLVRYLAGPTMMDSEECVNCKLFPICEGGCIWERHKNMFEGKEFDYLCHTRKDNIDRSFEMHYEQMLKGSK